MAKRYLRPEGYKATDINPPFKKLTAGNRTDLWYLLGVNTFLAAQIDNSVVLALFRFAQKKLTWVKVKYTNRVTWSLDSMGIPYKIQRDRNGEGITVYLQPTEKQREALHNWIKRRDSLV